MAAVFVAEAARRGMTHGSGLRYEIPIPCSITPSDGSVLMVVVTLNIDGGLLRMLISDVSGWSATVNGYEKLLIK